MADMWHDEFIMEQFTFEGKAAIHVLPDVPSDKWILKTEYFDAFPALELEMVRRGCHLFFLKNKSRWLIRLIVIQGTVAPCWVQEWVHCTTFLHFCDDFGHMQSIFNAVAMALLGFLLVTGMLCFLMIARHS